MNLEKERKFLLKYIPENLEPISIKQGYIYIRHNNQLRVRVINDEKAFITYKSNIQREPHIRKEFEYEIPIEDGLLLLEESKFTVKKIRYSTLYKGYGVDIDIYPNGLSVVEIEYDENLDEIPDYCGEEVTGDINYDNANIALSGTCKI